MTDARPPDDAEDDTDDHQEVLGRVDSLMARLRPTPVPHRPADALPPSRPVDEAPAAPVSTRPAPPASVVPLLTDVVSLGPVASRHPGVPVAPLAPRPHREPEPVALPNVDDLEQEVYRRLGDRLDQEVGALLERRVMPDLAGSLDLALAQMATEIKGSLRQLVRETIEETLQQQVRNLRLPLADGTSTDPDRS